MFVIRYVQYIYPKYILVDILKHSRLMVFNATFNTISIYIMAISFMVEESGVVGENHRPVASH